MTHCLDIAPDSSMALGERLPSAWPVSAGAAEALAPTIAPQPPSPGTTVSLSALIEFAADQRRRQDARDAAQAATRALQARNAHD